MKNWVSYKNGNYTVKFNLKNGTKIRETEEDEFIPAFSECCDIKISDRCDGACSFCYEGSTPTGKHGKLDYEFLNHLHPYTEIAINGNDLSHPDLIPFLKNMKRQNIITNMTVNQIHFERHQEMIRYLVDKGLIYGIGISLRKATPEFIGLVKTYPTAVLHVINGIFTKEDADMLANRGLKMLILGYKHLRRGEVFYQECEKEVKERQNWLYNNLSTLIETMDVVSFDNLAIAQLNVRRFLSDEEWLEFFMGEDSEFTFYIDLVEGVFGKNSLATERFPIMNSIDEMFEKIRLRRDVF